MRQQNGILKATIDIAFARGGAHLPIADALRIPETDIISWGGDFCWGRGFFGFFLGRGIFFGAEDFFGGKVFF